MFTPVCCSCAGFFFKLFCFQTVDRGERGCSFSFRGKFFFLQDESPVHSLHKEFHLGLGLRSCSLYLLTNCNLTFFFLMFGQIHHGPNCTKKQTLSFIATHKPHKYTVDGSLLPAKPAFVCIISCQECFTGFGLLLALSCSTTHTDHGLA